MSVVKRKKNKASGLRALRVSIFVVWLAIFASRLSTSLYAGEWVFGSAGYAENPDVSESYMEVLADYLILCMEKQEKKERKLLTDNRMATVTKRETSFEGLVSQLENGEDGIYNLMTENKNMIF